MSDRTETIKHITDMVIIGNIGVRKRTEIQVEAYDEAIEFMRVNMQDVYDEYFGLFEKALSEYEVDHVAILAVLSKTENFSGANIVPDKNAIVDAINIVRVYMSSLAGQLENYRSAYNYFDIEKERLTKMFTLFVNTDKSWQAEAMTSLLSNEELDKKLTNLHHYVETLELRYDAVDKEFRALSRMLGAVMNDYSVPERPRVVRDAQTFDDITTK